MGTRSASEAASSEKRNSVCKSSSKASLVLEDGSASAASSMGDRREISGLRMTEDMSSMAALAPSFT